MAVIKLPLTLKMTGEIGVTHNAAAPHVPDHIAKIIKLLGQHSTDILEISRQTGVSVEDVSAILGVNFIIGVDLNQ